MAKKIIGKLEKPAAEKFKAGRKLYFIPLIYSGQGADEEYIKGFNKYWREIENQIGKFEMKLGKIDRVYHELVPAGGKDGEKALKELNEKSYKIVKKRLVKGTKLEALEDGKLLLEYMDWGKCLVAGLQSQEVLSKVFEYYGKANEKRNEHIAKRIDDTLKKDESGVLLMREGHQVQFPSDIQVFYVAPPALDEIKRWLRNRVSQSGDQTSRG
jgi:hypothetical protein